MVGAAKGNYKMPVSEEWKKSVVITQSLRCHLEIHSFTEIQHYNHMAKKEEEEMKKPKLEIV